jgi:hypothetical protein
VTALSPANDPEFGPVTTKFENVTVVLVTVTVPAMLATLGSIKLVADAAEVNNREPTPISPNSEILRTTFSFLVASSFSSETTCPSFSTVWFSLLSGQLGQVRLSTRK